MSQINSILLFIGQTLDLPFKYGKKETKEKTTYSGANFKPPRDGICTWTGNPATTNFAYLEISDNGEKIGFTESTKGRKMSITLPVVADHSYTVYGDNNKEVNRYYFPYRKIGGGYVKSMERRCAYDRP